MILQLTQNITTHDDRQLHGIANRRGLGLTNRAVHLTIVVDLPFFPERRARTMQLGPILDRELMRLARQRGSYGGRTVVPLVMLTVIWLNDLAWRYINDGPSTVQQVALFGRLTFAQFVVAQVMATLCIVPGYVSRSIADEKDRKTLTFLLSTRLSSASIITGKLAAGLWHYLACLLAGIPVVLLLPLFGGVEPELVVWTYAGLVSTALFVAGLSILNSVIARRGREAHRLTLCMIVAWLFGPLTLALALPRLSTKIYGWIQPANELVLASSPAGLQISLLGILPRGTFLGSLGRMIGIQLVSALLLTLGAIALLRPAWRRHQDGEPGRLARRVRSRSKPECRGQPMLWKEMHVGRARGGARLLHRLAGLSVVATIGFATSYAGVAGAALEVLALGYGTAAPTSSRTFFNEYLRGMTVLISSLYALSVVGIAAQGIALERMQETWLGLIATPIEGRQILRAKMFGAFWRVREGALVLVVLWSVGLIVGSVHPWGFIACLIGLGVSTWLLTAVGTYASLRAETLASASNMALLPVLLLCLSGFLPKALPEPVRSVVYGAGSIPLVESLMLCSYAEVNEGLLTTPSPTLRATGIVSRAGGGAVLLTCGLNILGAVLAATLLSRLAERQFDRLVGRPWRPQGNPGGPGPNPGVAPLRTAPEPTR
jgi:ABC-type transport system involved in multi-copper enzyme maturation permease subunit